MKHHNKRHCNKRHRNMKHCKQYGQKFCQTFGKTFGKMVPAVLLPLALLSTGVSVRAQTDAGLASNGLGLEEIVVTARKRAESLQDVPLSISAFTAADMERRAFRDLRDVAQATPGLEYEDFATSGLSTAPVIRGMGQTFTTSRIQNTGVFLDGIYLQRQSMVNPALLDVERIEVLKGPQNAQYGRNAFAGAINYITKKPAREFEGDIAVVLGDGDREDYLGSLSGPLGHNLYGRVSFGVTEYNGHTDNAHPFADSGPGGGRSTNDVLGGWDDESWALALDWEGERLRFGAAINHNEALREPQGFYYLDGARYVFDDAGTDITPNPMGPPTIVPNAPIGANCLNTATQSVQSPFPTRGNHAYCGKLPFDPPVLDDPRLAEAGYADTRGQVVVDPRSNAMDSESDIIQFSASYNFSDSLSLSYQFGWVEHKADSYGVVPGRSSLIGSVTPYLPTRVTPSQFGPPVVTALAAMPTSTADISTFNANPIEELEAESHELRLSWSGDGIAARVGLYYSENEDEDGGTFYFVQPCDSEATCSLPLEQQPNALDGEYVTVIRTGPPPPDPPPGPPPAFVEYDGIGVPHPFADTSGLLGNHAAYEDEIIALFGDVVWDINDAMTLTAEARFTREDKSFEQFTATFGAPPMGTGPNAPPVQTTDDETFDFFTPRLTFDWKFSDDSMVYALLAQGVKTGGFNSVQPEYNASQATYDEEKNTTFEIGSKNLFFDDRVALNASLYYIDWTDVQGVEAAASPDAWTADVVGNIGDAEVFGLEVDGVVLVTSFFNIDYSFTTADPKYKDAIYQSSIPDAPGTSNTDARSSWGCNNVECRADGNVDGKQIERTSKTQASVGFNFEGNLNEWDWGARLDFNYRSKMYATPLNLAHNGDRTITNANVYFSNESFDINFWGRNILDEEYVANSFVLTSFTRYIVSQGAGRSLGLTVRYNF